MHKIQDVVKGLPGGAAIYNVIMSRVKEYVVLRISNLEIAWTEKITRLADRVESLEDDLRDMDRDIEEMHEGFKAMAAKIEEQGQEDGLGMLSTLISEFSKGSESKAADDIDVSSMDESLDELFPLIDEK